MSEGKNDVKLLLDPTTLSKLNQLKNTLPVGEELPQKELSARVDSPMLLRSIESFLEDKSQPEEIFPRLGYLDNTSGLSERISAIATEHLGERLPVLHFTNAAVGNDIANLVSTGFLERFMKEGSKGQIHVGGFRSQEFAGAPFQDMTFKESSLIELISKARNIAKEFHHHGARTNKNQLGEGRGSQYSLPAVIVFPKPETLLRGSDNYNHWIVKDALGNDQIVSIIALDPTSSMCSLMKDRASQNGFLKKVIHGIGISRMHILQNQYKNLSDREDKQAMALYAHDLVDGYFIERKEFDSAFPFSELDPDTKVKIEQRREKYNLFQQ